MSLTIKAVSYKGAPPAQEISTRFDEQGGTIGRSPDNHLVLPDPEKFISRLHARIVFQGGQYFIQDSSTGGTFLGPNDTLLQHSQALLENGQRVRIGEYELVASLSAAQPQVPPIAEPVRRLEMVDDGFLNSPFSTPEKPEAADFFSSFIDQPESSVFHDSFTPPQVSDTAPPAAAEELDLGDLLSTLESLPGTGSLQKPDLPPLPDDFFAEESEASPPVPIHPEMALEPEDWQKQSQTQPEAESTAELFEHIPPLPEEQMPDDLLGLNAVEGGAHDRPFPDAQIPDDPFGVPEEMEKPVSAAEEMPGAFQIPRPSTGTARTPAVAERPQAAAPVAAAEIPPQQQPAAVADSELLRQFLAGAGITDPGFIPADQWPALMKTSGELLRSMVEGLMLVLRARAELKSQFRVSVTTMRSVDNNPLKFTPNVDDAMRLILAPTNPGFIPPKDAVREGFADIMNHQMAMTAGIQAALADILRSFDPELIEKSQGEGILFQKKAKCWEQYANRYPQLKAAALEEFFGDAFAEAYEKQMQLLGRPSKPH
ncbi:MAG: type VI secretion system-associated FHA domain protein TagH [Methylomonas sp.]